MRCEADHAVERGDQLERREARRRRDLLEGERVVEAIVHQIERGLERRQARLRAEAGAGAEPGLEPVPRKQRAEAADEQFLLPQQIVLLVHRAVQGEKLFDELRIVEHVRREKARLRHAEQRQHAGKARFREVERPVAPAAAAAHAPRMRLARIEHEHGVRLGEARLPAALEHRTADFRDGDDKRIVHVRRVVVRREVGEQQIDPRNAGRVPVTGLVAMV
ncbi:hypothetical protein Y027_5583 [Burkholderia pseudomallei TSV5]|nr:hypothetical protein Y027_5583 [Burkholderia pseudomallei TSV5]